MLQNTSLAVCWIILLASISSCATQSEKSISEMRNTISSLRVISFVEQSEINVEIVVAEGQGVLVESILNSQATKRAEESAEKFREVLQDYDYSQALQASLRSKIEELNWPNVTFEQRAGEKYINNPKDLMKGNKEDALLVLNSQYHLSPYLNSFEVSTRVSLYENKNQGNSGVDVSGFIPQAVLTTALKYQSRSAVPRVSVPTAEEVEARKVELREEYESKIKRAGVGARKSFETLLAKRLKQVESRLSKPVAKDYTAQMGEEFWLKNEAASLLAVMREGVDEQSRSLGVVLSSAADTEYSKEQADGVATLLITARPVWAGGKTNVMTTSRRAWLVTQVDDRKILRLDDRFYYNIASGEIVRQLDWRNL